MVGAMSGGFFGYSQHHIQDIIGELEAIIRRGKLYPDDEWWDSCCKQQDLSYTEREVFLAGIAILKIAYIYAQRIDYYLSGDDSLECLLKRLQEDLGAQVQDVRNPCGVNIDD
jgi:hypothetical protein